MVISLLAGLTLLSILMASYGLTLADDLRGRIGQAMHKATGMGRWITDNVREQAELVRLRTEKRLKQDFREESDALEDETNSFKDNQPQNHTTGSSEPAAPDSRSLSSIWVNCFRIVRVDI